MCVIVQEFYMQLQFETVSKPKAVLYFISISMSLGAVFGIVLLNLVSGNNNNEKNNNNNSNKNFHSEIFIQIWLVLVKMQIHLNNNSCFMFYVIFYGFNFLVLNSISQGQKFLLCLSSSVLLLSEHRLPSVSSLLFWNNYNFILWFIWVFFFFF